LRNLPLFGWINFEAMRAIDNLSRAVVWYIRDERKKSRFDKRKSQSPCLARFLLSLCSSGYVIS
jgi:hypothetical protein